MKRLNPALLCLVLGIGLAGCAAQSASRYYTLVPQAADAAATAARAAKPYAISVQTVHVPEQVDRPQIVISESGSARITPLNQSLWSSPLSDEIRRALSVELSARLGVLDVPAGAAPSSLPLWKISVVVERFDSVFGARAVLDATWRLQPEHGAGKKPHICRAQIAIPVEDGVPALVDGQRRAVRDLAGLIAAQLSGRSLASAKNPSVSLKGCV